MRLQFEFDKRQQYDAEHGTFELSGDKDFEMKENPAANEQVTEAETEAETEEAETEAETEAAGSDDGSGSDAGEEQPASLWG